MLPEPHFAPSIDVGDVGRPATTGLLAATLRCDGVPYACATLVAELDAAAIRQLRQDALAMRARYGQPITIETRFVASPHALHLLAALDDLATHEIHVVTNAVASLGHSSPTPRPDAPFESPVAQAASPGASYESQPASTTATAAPAPAARPFHGPPPPSPDPFGLDPEFRRGWLTPLRFLFERYWRIETSGLEHVPDCGAALIAANHSGAVPADAFMLAVALELRRPARCLRVLYDRFVDALPMLGPTYRRLGGVSASLANAELLLQRGEVVGLFPEGIAGVEKRCTDRYRLRPFKTGTARLAVRTGAPIVPVSIVGAEEAYPVVARLYRLGRLVGVPWIPVTATFPLCGIAGALPLPTKWRIHFGEPIVPPVWNGRAEAEEDLVAETTGRLRTAIATGLSDLLAKRQGIFV